MQSSTMFVAVLALLVIGAVNAQTNCNEIEFDAFSIGTNGRPFLNLAQLLTPGTGNDGISFANTIFPITLTRTIVNGQIDIQLILSPNQGFVPTIFPNGSIIDVYYTIVPDNITVSLNGGTPQVQLFNRAGNNFTFTNFLGDGSKAFYNILNVAVSQNSTAPGATSSCTSVYAFNITNPPNATIKGDPQFMGLRGQSYQVHGIDGAVYNILSEKETQVNSRFVYLSQGVCPILNGVADTNCWSHPGSYLGEMSFQQVVDGVVHKALIVAGTASEGFKSLIVDGAAVAVGGSSDFGAAFSLSYPNSHTINVKTSHFEFSLSNSDLFINQAVRSRVSLPKLNAHGLLGQTHKMVVYPTSIRYIDGDVDDYAIADNDMFGTDFVFNKFEN